MWIGSEFDLLCPFMKFDFSAKEAIYSINEEAFV